MSATINYMIVEQVVVTFRKGACPRHEAGTLHYAAANSLNPDSLEIATSQSRAAAGSHVHLHGARLHAVLRVGASDTPPVFTDRWR